MAGGPAAAQRLRTEPLRAQHGATDSVPRIASAADGPGAAAPDSDSRGAGPARGRDLSATPSDSVIRRHRQAQAAAASGFKSRAPGHPFRVRASGRAAAPAARMSRRSRRGHLEPWQCQWYPMISYMI